MIGGLLGTKDSEGAPRKQVSALNGGTKVKLQISPPVANRD
jgi:hypothetical protein